MSLWKENVLAGKCGYCGTGKPHLSFKGCKKCLKTQTRSYIRRTAAHKARGICVHCHSRHKLPYSVKCFRCWLGFVSYHNLGSRSFKPMLLRLAIEQKFTCPFTGRRLIPGKNMSLDHIVPVSKGGSNDKGNLQWVDYQVNLAKSTLSTFDFLGLVNEIYKRSFR